MVLIGRSSAGGSCEISVRDIFCFLSVFCDPGSQLSPCFTDVYLFALVAWNFDKDGWQSSKLSASLRLWLCFENI